MKILPKIFGAVVGSAAGIVINLAAAALPAPAYATELIIVNQSALRFVCLFDADCSHSVGPAGIGALPASVRGSDPRLVSLSFEAKSGTPGAGTTAYAYQLDLTREDRFTECLAGLVVNFGEPARMPSDIANVAHVFVITTGGPGSVGVRSAEQEGNFIQFNFDGPVCAGQSSFFFGLAAKNSPVTSQAMLFGYGSPPIKPATARTPRH